MENTSVLSVVCLLLMQIEVCCAVGYRSNIELAVTFQYDIVDKLFFISKHNFQ